jgi:hypothetical protein
MRFDVVGRELGAQGVENGAVGPAVAVAFVGELLQGRFHRLQFTYLDIEFGDVIIRQLLDLAARARLVQPQAHQVADLLHRKNPARGRGV